MATLAEEWANVPLSWIPSAANGVSVTPNASAFANSSYTQLTASIGSDITMAALTFNPGVGTVEVEVDIARGAGGSEVVMTTFRFAVGTLANSPFCMIILPIAQSGIVNGDRVSVRMRKTGTSVTAWTFCLGYYVNPVLGITITSSKCVPLPSAAAGGAVTTGTVAWANSSYTQLRAASGSALIVGAVSVLLATNTELEVDIATGTAGAEVVISTIRMRSVAPGVGLFVFENPLDNIAASTRVAVRTRHSSTTSATANISLMTFVKPI